MNIGRKQEHLIFEKRNKNEETWNIFACIFSDVHTYEMLKCGRYPHPPPPSVAAPA